MRALLAVLVGISAGMHAALIPEHLEEMPPLGDLFIVAAVIGVGLAAWLALRPGRLPVAAVGLFLAGQLAAWALFVTVAVPGFMGTPEGIEPIALACKAVELAGLALVPLAL